MKFFLIKMNSDNINYKQNMTSYHKKLKCCIKCNEEFIIDKKIITVCKKCNIIFSCYDCGDITLHHKCL